jgi:hypothetical protein
LCSPPACGEEDDTCGEEDGHRPFGPHPGYPRPPSRSGVSLIRLGARSILSGVSSIWSGSFTLSCSLSVGRRGHLPGRLIRDWLAQLGRWGWRQVQSSGTGRGGARCLDGQCSTFSGHPLESAGSRVAASCPSLPLLYSSVSEAPPTLQSRFRPGTPLPVHCGPTAGELAGWWGGLRPQDAAPAAAATRSTEVSTPEALWHGSPQRGSLQRDGDDVHSTKQGDG